MLDLGIVKVGSLPCSGSQSSWDLSGPLWGLWCCIHALALGQATVPFPQAAVLRSVPAVALGTAI